MLLHSGVCLKSAAIIALSFAVVWCARIPDNPCNNIFKYKTDNSGIYFGEVEIPSDHSRTPTLSVNVSLVGLYHNAKLKLELLTPQDEVLTAPALKYRINFPFQDVLPKITQIQFNGNIYCYGPPEELGTEGVTNLWSYTMATISSYTIQSGINMNPFINSINSNVNNIDSKPNEEALFVSPTSKPVSTVITPQRLPSLEKCGIANNIVPLIVNGAGTTENEYPWLVALFRRQGVNYQFHCSSNLISENYVVTAAHCVQFHKAPLIQKEDILLVLGRSNLTFWATSGAIVRSASKVLVYPEYKQFTGHGDIALIKFDEPVTYSQSIRPICLWSGDESLNAVVNSRGTVAGWGKEENGRQVTAQPRKVSMKIVSQEECLRSHAGFTNLTSQFTLCAGDRDGSGPCIGDSGAGLIINKNGMWFLRGLVSTAIKADDKISCDLHEYVVFSDAAKFGNWISSSIK